MSAEVTTADYLNHRNQVRAERARKALDTYAMVTDGIPLDRLHPEDQQLALVDLVCCLMHLASQNEVFDFKDALAEARMHFEAETVGGEE